MKLSVGKTYKEAITQWPMTGIHREDQESIKAIRNEFYVVLDYKLVVAARYYWKRHDKWHVYLVDTKTKKNVTRIKRVAGSKRGIRVTKFFSSIYKAQEWAYEHDRAYYDSIPNISTKR